MSSEKLKNNNFDHGDRTRSREIAELPPLPKSRELFSGDLNGEVSYSFNSAVIAAQVISGNTLSQGEFQSFMPSDWQDLSVGQALDLFDKGLEKITLQRRGYSEKQIDLANSIDEDPSLIETLDSEDTMSDATGQLIPDYTPEDGLNIPVMHGATLEANDRLRDIDRDLPNTPEFEEERAKAIALMVSEIEWKAYGSNRFEKELVVQGQLQEYDERFGDNDDALTRSEWEKFVRIQPQNTAYSMSVLNEPFSPENIPSDPMSDDGSVTDKDFLRLTSVENWQETVSDPVEIKKEIDTAMEQFEELVREEPEYEEGRADYIGNLHAKMTGLYGSELTNQLMRFYLPKENKE
jgi:hypothetical protein